jgi:micrococcal nuclease
MSPSKRYPNGVVDGDTVSVNLDLGLRQWMHDVRIRLYGVSAPEVRGAERVRGIESKEALERLIAHMLPDGDLLIRTYKDQSDSFGRWLGELWTPDGMSCLNALLVQHGFAVWRVDW